MDKRKTQEIIDNEKHILKGKHWTEIIDVLNFLKENYGKQSVLNLIKQNENIFKTSSTLKSNLKKKGISISYIKGKLIAELM